MSKIVHYELNTSNPKAARKFYSGLFGWKAQDMPMGGGHVYTMLSTADGNIGGIQKNPMAGAPSAWVGYVDVPSVAKAVAKAKKLGGEILVPQQVVPGPDGQPMGEFAIIADPTGATMGVWGSPKPAPKKRAAKKAAKKATKKRTAKKTPMKTAKKAAKKPAKKRATKKATRKPANKATKKRAAKKATKKRTAKRAPRKR